MDRETHCGYRRFFYLSGLAAVACALLLALAMPVWADPAHVHKGGSPFEGKDGRKNAHCLLNKHGHGNLPCPHTLLYFTKNKPGFFIAVECGGSRQGPLPVKTSFDRNPGATPADSFAGHQVRRMARPGDPRMRDFHLPYSLDRPPQSV